MIIGIDIRVLGSVTKSGIEEYTENILSHIFKLDKKIKFKLFYSSLNTKPMNYDWLGLSNVELYNLRIPNKIIFATTNLLGRPYIDKLLGGTDVFFSPHFLLAGLSPGTKRVVTFHDLSYIYFPEFFSWRRNIWHHFQMKPSWQSRFADKIIAVSQSTKNDLCSKYRVDPAKIEVIYSGISPSISRPSDPELGRFKIDKKLPDKFILFLAKLEPRKNVDGLIRAFNIIKKSSGFEDVHLVIVGSPGWLYREIFREASNSEYKDKIIFRNYVEDYERPFYYSLASVFVYPSFFEGFGFPPLEAMVCKTPVVVSNNSSLPEVVGQGGILIDPYNVDEIAYVIKNVLISKKLRSHVIKNAEKEVAKFNWKKTAEQTLKCLTSV